MAAKIFEVNDVLPATTQLRISWEYDIGYDYKSVYTNYDLILITDFGGGYVEIDGTIIFDMDGLGGYDYPNYTSGSGDHPYIDIDTSAWSSAKRTVTSIGSGSYDCYWEDLAPAPSGYTITFETNGGTSISDIEEATELPSELPIPTKSGYTFVSWYYDSAFTQIANAGDTLSANVTLYAKWELNTYTITYNSNGGSSIPQTSDATQLPNPLPIPTKSGYKFVAWYYESNFQTRAKAGDTIESNVTLYAKWHNLRSLFTEIADAIRSKDGTSENIRDLDFGERVKQIQGAKEEETKTITPDFSSGNEVVTPTSGKVMSQVTINKDTTNHVAGNIKKDVTLYGVTGTLEGGVPLEQFISFSTDYSGGLYNYRLLTFQSRNPFGWGADVDIKIYYKNSSDEDVLLASQRARLDKVYFIVIPRSYGNLKIVMSLAEGNFMWSGFSGFYAKTAQPNVITQLTEPSDTGDFVLSYIDFDVFHVVFTGEES